MEELDMAIKVAEEMGDTSTLASIYAIRGMIFFQTAEYTEAISDFDEAIKIMEGIDRKQLDQNELAKAYAGRGMARLVESELELSIPDLERGIEIWEHLKEEGKFVDENILNMAYGIFDKTKVKDIMAHIYMIKGNRFDKKGKLLWENQHYDKAKEEFRTANEQYYKAIENWKELQEKGVEIDKGELANAYMNIGANYYQIGENGKSLANYLESIKIGDKLENDSVEQDIFDIVMVYKNRAMVCELDGNLKEAIKYNVAALRIVNQVFRKEPELHETYYYTLVETIELMEKENDKKRFNNVIEEFLYDMIHYDKTKEAEEIQNSILEIVRKIYGT